VDLVHADWQNPYPRKREIIADAAWRGKGLCQFYELKSAFLILPRRF